MRTLFTKNSQKSGIAQLFPALLFFVFILCTVFTILIGSRVYENIRGRDNESFYTDTALAYITNKVRQGDLRNAVEVRQIDDTPVLILGSDFGGMTYKTWIYEKDGALYELFTDSGSSVGTADGLEIMECPSLQFSLQETASGSSLLTITLAESSQVSLLLRTPQKGGL